MASSQQRVATATWRGAAPDDVEGIMGVADLIHAALPEKSHIFAERVDLFPQGCFVLVENSRVLGYAISFPIRHGRPPALNALLGQMAPDAQQYYIHDVAILPEARGRGAASEVIGKLLSIAERYPSACLISVYGTGTFWSRYGFEAAPVDAAMTEKLRGYGEDASYLVRQKSEC